MNGFFNRLSEALARGPVVLATVVTARGSTPRIAGARQFVAADGETWGSIGGGATEAGVLDAARETLSDGQPRTFLGDLRGKPGDIREGICGGTMTVWIVRLAGAEMLDVIRSLESALEAGQRVALTTRLDRESPLSIGDRGQGEFTETLEPPPRLLILGAGHIGRSLAALATGLDFRLEVHDDRPEWLIPSAFPAGCDISADLGDTVARLAAWRGMRFAVLVTRGFAQDVRALGALVELTDLDYVGLLGSRARIATVLAAAREAKSLPWPKGVLHAPIGVEIGAETPAEIAVSIAAELIVTLRRDRESATRAGS